MSGEIPRVALAPGYTISRLLKGGWQLAGGHGPVDAAAAMDDMDRFVDAGITTFDCADIYTGVETLIGTWLKRRRPGAGAIQVHTKYVPDLHRLPAHSRADVSRGIERSLTQLGVDCLDLVQLHWWDYDVPGYVDAASWLDEQRKAGKIRHVGLTNFDQTHLSEIVVAGVPVTSHQVQYSVLDRRPANGMSARCLRDGISLICYGGLAGGFLSNSYLRTIEPSSPLENRSLVKYRLVIDEFGGWTRFQELLDALGAVAGRHDVGIGTVAIRWVLYPTSQASSWGRATRGTSTAFVKPARSCSTKRIAQRLRAFRPVRLVRPATSTSSNASRADSMRRSCATTSATNSQVA